jgi:hypothetical protein
MARQFSLRKRHGMSASSYCQKLGVVTPARNLAHVPLHWSVHTHYPGAPCKLSAGEAVAFCEVYVRGGRVLVEVRVLEPVA